MPKISHRPAMPIYSIVIPAFEESVLITTSLKAVYNYLDAEKLLPLTEVIVVTATSKDDTAALAKAQASLFDHFQLVEPGRKVGKGRDVKAGVEASKGRFIIFTDADLATPIYHCKAAFNLLESGQADMVIGVRNLWTIHKGISRKMLSVCANWLVRLFLLPTTPDSQCGFKGFTRPAADQLFPKLTILGWGFDMELLVLARAAKLRVKKQRIDDWTDPKLEAGLTGESTMQASLATLKELFVIWHRRLKGAYR